MLLRKPECPENHQGLTNNTTSPTRGDITHSAAYLAARPEAPALQDTVLSQGPASFLSSYISQEE